MIIRNEDARALQKVASWVAFARRIMEGQLQLFLIVSIAWCWLSDFDFLTTNKQERMQCELTAG